MKKILSPMEKICFPESEELPEGAKEIEVKDIVQNFIRMLNMQSTVVRNCIFRS